MPDKSQPWNAIQRVALLSTYVPRRCGIGTFSSDLAEALARTAPETEFWVAALNDRPEGYRYPHRVKFEVLDSRRSDYRLAADFLNMGQTDIVSLQHEYGIFGGPDGQMILDVLRRLRTPVVTTLHTVLKEPTDSQRETLEHIAEVSDRLVVLSRVGEKLLREVYDIPDERIVFIPHGIHDTPFVDPNFYKDQFGVEGRKVVLTFGLLSPGKGIEGMIDALPQVVDKHPEAVYIVLGATHPAIKARYGEDYRSTLERRAEERGVRDHIIFHNKFVELDELMEFLGAADIYVTPYLSEAQVVSGTLAYALGAGKATISTPYWYAEEMLADGRGMLTPFNDPDGLANAINHLLENEVERHAMRKRAYQFTRQMRWEDVARQYMDLFAEVRADRRTHPRPASQRTSLQEQAVDLPDLKLDHVETLTDSIGIFAKSHFNLPDFSGGYCTDDVAQGLIVAVQAADHVTDRNSNRPDMLAGRYLAFLHHAFDDETGLFRHRLSFDRRWTDEEQPEETYARAMWGLGVAVARSRVPGHIRMSTELFLKGLPMATEVKHPHALAYTLLGLHAYLRRFSGDSQAKRSRDELGQRLMEMWQANMSDDWPWVSDEVTYAGGRLAQALLMAGRWSFNDEMVQLALQALNWLVDMHKSPHGNFAPIGSHGGLKRAGERAMFDQLPIAAVGMIEACLEAHRVTDDRRWRDRAQWCFNWFLGQNDLRMPLFDQRTGGCFDALQPQGVDENQGARATLCWLTALLCFLDEAVDLRAGVSDVVPATPASVAAAAESAAGQGQSGERAAEPQTTDQAAT